MTETWKNWAGDQHCAPAQLARPTSEDELAEVIAQATARGLPVRAVGSGHSFTDIACTDGVLVDTSGMQRVIAADAESGLVTVQAGITLHALGLENASHGLALENQGDIDAQSLAGALATATHGTGVRFGNLSTRVVGMRLVTASGDVVDLTEGRPGGAARRARVARRAGDRLAGDDPVRTAVHPAAPRPAAAAGRRARSPRRARRRQRPLRVLPLAVYAHGDDAVDDAQRRGGRAAAEVEAHAPGAGDREHVLSAELRDRPALRAPGAAAQPPDGRRDVGERASRTTRYKVYASDARRALHRDRVRHPARARTRGAGAPLALVERRKLPILVPVEVRFAAGDDALLSTAHERETCYIAAHQYHRHGVRVVLPRLRGDHGLLRRAPALGQAPLPVRRDAVATRYPEWDRFQAVRARLDPDGVFANDYTRRVLGPVGAPVRPRCFTPAGAAGALRDGVRRPRRAVRVHRPRRDVVQLGRDAGPQRRQADPRRVESRCAAGRCCARSSTATPATKALLTFTLPETLWLARAGLRATSSSPTRPPTARALRELAALTAEAPDGAPV